MGKAGMAGVMNARTVTFVGPHQIEVRDRVIAPPAPGHALVRARLSAISSGTELLIYRGEAPAEMPADSTLTSLSGTLSFPLAYGYATAGIVEQVGSPSDRTWIGRRVFAFQPHASQFVAALTDLHPIPDGVGDEDAVFLANAETAVGLLHDGAPLAGERVAVWGQGIVGLLATSLLARLPLDRLVTLDRFHLRRNASESLGATTVLDPAQANLADALRLALGEQAADLTYELTGNPAALVGALKSAGFASRLVLGSWYGTKPVSLDLGGAFHRSRIRILASQVSHLDPGLTGRWSKARRLDFAWSWLARLRPSGWITHRFELERAAEAYSLLDLHPDQALQVVLTYP
jgi:2-desacetyl-2-hydroxyethyl bacteriochlorophyllide A dehydrogenase